MIILSICLILWIVEHRNAESWKKTASFLNKQLDSSYRAFTEQRCLMKKITVENELLKAENELLNAENKLLNAENKLLKVDIELMEADNEKLKQKTAEFIKGKYYGAEIRQTEFVVTRKFESKKEGLAERVGFLRRSLLREMVPLIEDNALFNVEKLCDDTYRITARLKLLDFQNARVFLYDDLPKQQIDAERTEPFNDPVQENRKPIPWEAD